MTNGNSPPYDWTVPPPRSIYEDSEDIGTENSQRPLSADVAAEAEKSQSEE